MPTIASFENIDIKMQKEGSAQHKKPHIHAYYGEQSAAGGSRLPVFGKQGSPRWRNILNM